MRYVAFLRGINVGGRIIKMADLKACFESLKFDEVSTVLASGNVIFESGEQNLAKLTETIEAGLTKQFNYPAKVIVLSVDALRGVIEHYPFNTDPERHDYVIFLSSPIGQELQAMAEIDPAVEQIALGDGVIYWQVQKGMSLKSTFAALLSKAKYKEFNTVRNCNTLQKITRLTML